MRRVLLVAVLVLGLAAPASALDTIYLVRHAERAEGWPPARELDALHPLSSAGTERAARLAAYFAKLPLLAVYASTTTRALATALPIAQMAKVPLLASAASSAPDSMATFLSSLRTQLPQAGAVLIVGHSNTIPLLLHALGAAPECDAALGISAHDYGPGIDGYEGLWRVRLDGEGCTAFERMEQPTGSP